MGDNGKSKIISIDPSNTPPGMFMVVVIEKMNDQGIVETTVQGKIDEPYALECLRNGVKVLEQHQAKNKEGVING